MENIKDILNNLKFNHIKYLENYFKYALVIEKEFLDSKYTFFNCNYQIKNNIKFVELKSRQYKILFIVNDEEVFDLFVLSENTKISFTTIENILILKFKYDDLRQRFVKYNLNDMKHTKEDIEFSNFFNVMESINVK